MMKGSVQFHYFESEDKIKRSRNSKETIWWKLQDCHQFYRKATITIEMLNHFSHLRKYNPKMKFTFYATNFLSLIKNDDWRWFVFIFDNKTIDLCEHFFSHAQHCINIHSTLILDALRICDAIYDLHAILCVLKKASNYGRVQ